MRIWHWRCTTAAALAVVLATAYGDAAATTGMSSSESSSNGGSSGGSASSGIDLTKLPLGDGKFSTTGAKVGYVYVCDSNFGRGGAFVKGPWFNADGTTWNAGAKLAVQGAVSWVSSFTTTLTSSIRSISGNGLPSHATGVFPTTGSDPVYVYDRNPNRIAAQTIAWGLPGHPKVAAEPSCVPRAGAIGVLLAGARLYNALDFGGRDAVAWEGEDTCQGHPEHHGAYHYHMLSSCVSPADTAGRHSALAGYAADGFGIYGYQGENGVALRNTDLDECHGHTHAIPVNGQMVTQYHYHATHEFPYTLGCFRGTPATID
jgi:hypothetical protein